MVQENHIFKWGGVGGELHRQLADLLHNGVFLQSVHEMPHAHVLRGRADVFSAPGPLVGGRCIMLFPANGHRTS